MRTHPFLLTACLLPLLLPPPAAAQGQPASGVTIYGLFDAATRRADNAGTGGRLTTMEDGIITGSRLGLTGRESIGNGWAARFTAESGFDPSTGTSLQGTTTADFGQVAASPRFWGREIHVGLTTPWATVTLGRQYTVAHTLAARFQPLGNPNSAAHSLFSSHHVARQDNVLRVDVNVAGVGLVAARTLGEVSGNESANGSWALGAGYAGKDWAVGAYAQQMENLSGSERRKILGAGGNVRVLPMLALYGGWMQRTHTASAQRNRAWQLGANVELGPNATLSMAHFDDRQSGSAALKGLRQVSWVTLSYRFSRRSDVYGVVDRNRVLDGYARPAFMASKGTQTGLVIGLRHRF